jgi:uncharacterized protein DUF5317
VSLALPLLAALAVAPLLGGRWSRIASVRIRVVWIFYIAIALQIVAFPFKRLPWRTPDKIGTILWIVSFFAFLLAMAVNARLPGVPLIAAGLVSNLTAVLANGGHMPALPSALHAAGMHFVTSNNSTAMASPHLAWLVDRWAMPDWVPWGNVFSVGDIAVMTGGVVLVLAVTGALRFTRAAPSVAARS